MKKPLLTTVLLSVFVGLNSCKKNDSAISDTANTETIKVAASTETQKLLRRQMFRLQLAQGPRKRLSLQLDFF